ncbi:MAG: hypothetical protein ACN0LA_11235 [Candidatus Longimicrobiales bacterium M2_2A_002]
MLRHPPSPRCRRRARHRTPPPSPPWIAAAIVVAVAALAGCAESPGEEAAEPALGTVDFPTSCSAAVQPDLERGLALLHHMMYEQARDVFEAATRRESDCAMAYWGLAMSRFQPLWGSAQIDEGRDPAERAVALDAPTERERAYARAAHAFFEGEDLRLNERIRSWEAAMEALHRARPGDPEAQSLYGLAVLAVDPADRTRQDRADSLLRAVHETMPRHPGAIHYSIHVHDVEGRAEAGREFARVYDRIAPSVPHALHMPSHIYVRLGEWDKVIDWNIRSAEAALEHPAGDHISLHYPHALDYLMYGYLQRGQDRQAEGVLEELRSRERYQPAFPSAYAMAAIPARWHIERRDWDGAAALPPGSPETFPWDRFPAAEAMTRFARGLGAARSGDPDAATIAEHRLRELEEAARSADDTYWADRIRVQRLSVAAWRALALDSTERAVRVMDEAASLASGMEKSPITPGNLQPARELLGDLLLEADRPAEALEAYTRSLETWPRRYHSLLGAARAADRQDGVDAGPYYRALAELTGPAVDREGAREARRWLDRAG